MTNNNTSAAYAANVHHTPGPWIVSRNNAGMIPAHFQPLEIMGRDGERRIASGLGNGRESEANARLIASAPELLAIARRVMEASVDGWYIDRDGQKCDKDHPDAVWWSNNAEDLADALESIADECRAAIAKAEGRA